jgi:hypothetical protein
LNTFDLWRSFKCERQSFRPAQNHRHLNSFMIMQPSHVFVGETERQNIQNRTSLQVILPCILSNIMKQVIIVTFVPSQPEVSIYFFAYNAIGILFYGDRLHCDERTDKQIHRQS